jgi:tetratricopeptide (TPR) repeat protein
MPTIFVDEVALSPYSQGINLYKAMLVQKLWAQEQGYPVFGESPSADESYGYDIFGSPPAGLSRAVSRGVIAPHSSFMFPFELAMKNLRTMWLLFPEAYLQRYGFASAVDTRDRETIKLYRSFEQGIIVLSSANLLLDNFVQRSFLNGLAGEKIQKFLQEEEKPFFTPFDIAEEITELYWQGKRLYQEGRWQEASTNFDYINFLNQTYNLNFDYQDWLVLYQEIRQFSQHKLEELYQKAKESLKGGNYSQALGYLEQIVIFDLDYKDASQLYRISSILAKGQFR